MLASVLQLLAALGLFAVPPEPAGLALALVVVAVAALALVRFSCAARTEASSHARQRGAVDVSVPLTQSDPDAAGHQRPRAPGRAIPAA
ncbi:MAG: DUF6412 domain-containing protein [Microbacterium sp.]|uniref:DUF6412 domain-containing protein n=1 Tax=Microbacterium sp. TaxID=51671 RepID=UPI0039E6F971